MSEHTPGPWKPTRSHEDFDGPMWELDDDERASYEARPFVRIEAANGETVAAAHDLFEFKDANARLIAAAPDLLAALEELVAFVDALPNADAGLRARAAIARAKGGEDA